MLELALEDSYPGTAEVRIAWEEAAQNVRTFRDAQRYDRALAAVESSPAPFGEAAHVVDLLKAYASVALMSEISEERERVLPR